MINRISRFGFDVLLKNVVVVVPSGCVDDKRLLRMIFFCLWDCFGRSWIQSRSIHHIIIIIQNINIYLFILLVTATRSKNVMGETKPNPVDART
jgi:hypothetical protein